MKIVIDENVAYAKEAFGKFGEIVLSEGRNVTNELLKDADALIIRSVTIVDKVLLENTNIKFVGTATIGVDHVDTDYLSQKGICFANAKGCNANAVAEYFLTALLSIANKHNIELAGKSLGVVGYGNVGKKVVSLAEKIGLKTFVNDPPLEREGYDYKFYPLNDVLKCDIITFHVPLNNGGVDNTIHLLNENNINQINENAIIFNTARGQVVDNNALLKKINKHKNNIAVLDVWENEPKCNNDLIGKVEIGTPHIAGYSVEGKVKGTEMILDAFCSYFGFGYNSLSDLYTKKNPTYNYDNKKSLQMNLYEYSVKVYDIFNDSKQFEDILIKPLEEQPKFFDDLRKNYNLRYEFTDYLFGNK